MRPFSSVAPLTLVFSAKKTRLFWACTSWPTLVHTYTRTETKSDTAAHPLPCYAQKQLIGRALRGVLAGFFKTSDARQVVDAGASSVMNACRARLRMTPLALRVAKKGSYR